MRGVAAVGDVLDINCWSNIPYYFYTTGASLGLVQEPWQLFLNKLKAQRLAWNTAQMFSGNWQGGFQYSKSFLQAAEKQIPKNYFTGNVISFNQVFPRANSIKSQGGSIIYYIDTTLIDFFNDPWYKVKLRKTIQMKAIELEKENYILADKLVTMSSWAKESLVSNYGIAPEKISVILPGANLPELNITNVKGASKSLSSKPIILGFVGKDWERKGLQELIHIAEIIQKGGLETRVKVIGHCPTHLINHPLVIHTGYINKQTDISRFISELRTCDIGCLFSKGEALGISTLEFLSQGIPVTGFYHQGLKETLLEGASLRFEPNESIENIAGRLAAFLSNKPMVEHSRATARSYSQFVSWSRCLKEWKTLLDE